LSSTYTKDKVNGVLSPYDGLSRGIISSLKGVGYAPGDTFPVVTGQDAEVPSVKAMMAGEQYSTVFKDTRNLAKLTASMADAALSGKEVPINDTKTYNNGKKVVPSNLLVPVAVGKDQIQKELVDSGYIAADKLK
jgi:putative multiple sugar transport system substrate-binding protein